MASTRKKKNHFRSTWKDYFALSNRVRRGLMVLFGLIFIEIVILLYLHYLPTSAQKIDVQKFKKEVDDFYASVSKDSTAESHAGNKQYASAAEYSSNGKNPKEAELKAELFSFNPNHLPPSEWKRLGFSDRQIHSILNYEAKGGRFRNKEDVKKMYAIHADEFSRIEPFIAIPGTEKAAPTPFSTNHKVFLVVDIGTADSTELDKLPMVGEYLAQKIYNYREKLGGFYSVSQLKEVRGLRDSALQVILPHITLKDSVNLRRINLNAADYSELNRHPYIDNTLANIIISYRKKHGAFTDVSDLRKVALVDAELYRKIAPYLKIE